MKLKYTPEDAARGKQIPCEAAELLAEIQPQLNGFAGSKCRLLLFASKFRKLLVEFEICDADDRAIAACFAKSHTPSVAAQTYDSLTQLAAAGFCPPSRFTITRPLAYLKERSVVVVEKAPGTQLTTMLFERCDGSTDATTAAARWLAALHGTKVDAAVKRLALEKQLRRFCGELIAALPAEEQRLRAIEQQTLAGLEPAQSAVPSHRDFHPDNVFVAADGRVTVIDLDQFGMQEPVGDVAYCLAQMAIMSYLRTGTFATTAAARDAFLTTYARNASAVDGSRLAWHFAFAFLKSLHYELCVFHTDNQKIVEPWLAAAAASLNSGEMTLPTSGQASGAAR